MDHLHIVLKRLNFISQRCDFLLSQHDLFDKRSHNGFLQFFHLRERLVTLCFCPLKLIAKVLDLLTGAIGQLTVIFPQLLVVFNYVLSIQSVIQLHGFRYRFDLARLMLQVI